MPDLSAWLMSAPASIKVAAEVICPDTAAHISEVRPNNCSNNHGFFSYILNFLGFLYFLENWKNKFIFGPFFMKN